MQKTQKERSCGTGLMQNFYRLLKKMDFSMLLTVTVIIVLGLFVLDSAAASKESNYVMKQLLFVGIGTVAVFALLKFDYSVLKNYPKEFYIASMVLLVAVLIIGVERGGAKGWFAIGGFTLQPAEFCKILMILSYAQFLSARRENLQTFQDKV